MSPIAWECTCTLLHESAHVLYCLRVNIHPYFLRVHMSLIVWGCTCPILPESAHVPNCLSVHITPVALVWKYPILFESAYFLYCSLLSDSLHVLDCMVIYIPLFLSGLVRSIRKVLTCTLRYPGFKSYLGWWPGHYNNLGCSARLKTIFELNPVTEAKQGNFPFYLTSCMPFIPWQSTCPFLPDSLYVPFCLAVYMSLFAWQSTCLFLLDHLIVLSGLRV